MLLTSHYMADVEALCRRVVVIHRGSLLFDGELSALVDRFAAHKVITVALEEGSTVSDEELAALVGGTVTGRTPTSVTVQVPRAQTPSAAGQLLARLPVVDLTIEDPPIEGVIEDVFASPAEEEAGRDGR